MNKKNDEYTKLVQLMPPIKSINIRSESDFYGVSVNLAEKVGLPFVPFCKSAWKHGWLFPKLKFSEQITAHQRKEENLFLVAKAEHAIFLNSKGIPAKAVGMPFMYVDQFDKSEICRIKNSLLVMPPHSLPTTAHNWDEESYAKTIVELKKDFDFVVVCIHQVCLEQNLWVETLKKYDIPWIVGASSIDKNALIRMRRIFKSFEYMTTNVIGSHVLYASYCGCKVSIYGDYAAYSKEDYINDSTYNKYPFLLEHNLLYASEKNIKEKYPFLCTHPTLATINLEWAKNEIGDRHKVSLLKLVILLGWLPHTQIAIIIKKIFRKLKQIINNDNNIR